MVNSLIVPEKLKLENRTFIPTLPDGYEFDTFKQQIINWINGMETY